MKLLNTILAEQIRQGKVTVDIPRLDMDRLTESLSGEAAQTLREVAAVACAEEMTDGEKVRWIQERLA